MPRPGHVGLFVTGSIAVCVISWLALLRPTNPQVMELGVTLDLTLFIPTLYWLFLVRGKGWPLVSVLPVFLGALFLASLMIPEGRQGALQIMTYLAVPAEFALLGVLIHRGTKAIRVGRNSGLTDTLERIRSAVHEIVPNQRAADIIAFEASLLWYALLSWRSKPMASPNEGRRYTHHRKAGYGAVVAVLMLAIAVEITPIHALLARWSYSVAWIVTGLSLYSVVWLIGDYRAIRLRVTDLDANRLMVRFGIRWTMTVPRDQIESIRVIGGSAMHEQVDLRMALPGAQRVSLRLKTPVEASGPYGLRRRIQVFELGLDDHQDLYRELAAPGSSSGSEAGQ